MKIKFKYLLLASIVFASLINLLEAGSKDTANYIASKIETFDGTSAKIDVAYLVRINLNVPNTDVALFTAKTIDRLSMTFGGDILLIADEKDADSLIKKYGTNMEHNGGSIKYKSLTGKVGRIKHEGKVDIVFINISSVQNPEELPIEWSAATSLGTKPAPSQ